jgi:hypothetical protein
MNIRQICRFYNVGFTSFEGKYYRYYRLNRIFSLFLLIPVAHLEAP